MKLLLYIITLSTAIVAANADSDILENATNTFQFGSAENFYYGIRTADYDFSWTVTNMTDTPGTNTTGSVGVYSNNRYASWNNLNLGTDETTPQNSSQNIGLGPYFLKPNPTYWIADLTHNGMRYVTDSGNGEQRKQCSVYEGDLKNNVRIAIWGGVKDNLNMNIGMPSSSSCTNIHLVNTGKANYFSYPGGATYDFSWKVKNDAPYPIRGSFDTWSYNHIGLPPYAPLYASWNNNLFLGNGDTTPTVHGPFFYQSGNYWAADINYMGKRYYAVGPCSIRDSDLGAIPTNVYIEGNADGLTDLLIGRPKEWCERIPFIYMGSVN